MMLISIQPDTPASELMAAGYTRLPQGMFLPIHFQGAVRQSSGELAGFYSGFQSELLLWNLSSEDTDVRLLAFDSMGEAGAQTETLSLPQKAISYSSTPRNFQIASLPSFVETGVLILNYRFIRHFSFSLNGKASRVILFW